MSRFRTLFAREKPIIGMIHLPALPDYAQSRGIEQVVLHALRDLQALERGGIDGVLVENEYDRPHRVTAAPATISAMTRVTQAIVQKSKASVCGCEILLHDPKASLDVAKSGGAQFIRTDYFVDAMSRPGYGEFEIDPDGLIAHRSAINAQDILIFADIQVKYAHMIEPRPLRDSARIACEKGADAVVVTGDASGDAPTPDQLREAANGVADSGSDVPVLAGSGLDAGNAKALLSVCDGAIVGTSLMRNRAVDPAALGELMAALDRQAR